MDTLVKYRQLIGHVLGIGSSVGYFLYLYKTNGIVNAAILAPLIYLAGHLIVLKWYAIFGPHMGKKMAIDEKIARMDKDTHILKSGIVTMLIIGFVFWKQNT